MYDIVADFANESQPLFTSVNEFLAGLFVLLAFGGMAWWFLRNAMRAGD